MVCEQNPKIAGWMPGENSQLDFKQSVGVGTNTHALHFYGSELEKNTTQFFERSYLLCV